jgi:polysaccharide export outer membrane protein
MGFLVNHKGEIEYPRIGVIQTEGLSKAQLAAIIKGKLEKYLQNPVVNIRFLTFKVIMLGEVGNQGSISIPGERLTVLEAIGLSGGITWSGRRENVKIIRETNGVREMGIIDLTSKELFKSPYYNLQQNDIVIVDLNKRGRVTQDQQYTMSRISFAVGLITTAAVLISIFK